MPRWVMVGEELRRMRINLHPQRPPQLLWMSWKTPGMLSGQVMAHLH